MCSYCPGTFPWQLKAAVRLKCLSAFVGPYLRSLQLLKNPLDLGGNDGIVRPLVCQAVVPRLDICFAAPNTDSLSAHHRVSLFCESPVSSTVHPCSQPHMPHPAAPVVPPRASPQPVAAAILYAGIVAEPLCMLQLLPVAAMGYASFAHFLAAADASQISHRGLLCTAVQQGSRSMVGMLLDAGTAAGWVHALH